MHNLDQTLDELVGFSHQLYKALPSLTTLFILTSLVRQKLCSLDLLCTFTKIQMNISILRISYFLLVGYVFLLA